MSETPYGAPAPDDLNTETEADPDAATARAGQDLHERLQAVERALTDGEGATADLSAPPARRERLDRLAERLDDLEGRLAEAEAGVEAVRGYVGSIRAVNQEVERRADAALSAADAGDDGDGTAREMDLPGDGQPADRDRLGPQGTGEESVRDRLERLL